MIVNGNLYLSKDTAVAKNVTHLNFGYSYITFISQGNLYIIGDIHDYRSGKQTKKQININAKPKFIAKDVIHVATYKYHILFLVKDNNRLHSYGSSSNINSTAINHDITYFTIGSDIFDTKYIHDNKLYHLYKNDPIDNNVIQVSSGISHFAYIKSNGDLYFCGDNIFYEMSSKGKSFTTPQIIHSNVSQVSSGSYHIAFISKGNLHIRGSMYDKNSISRAFTVFTNKIITKVSYVQCRDSYVLFIRKGKHCILGHNILSKASDKIIKSNDQLIYIKWTPSNHHLMSFNHRKSIFTFLIIHKIQRWALPRPLRSIIISIMVDP